MALEQKLSLKLAQRLVMTPSLQQAIKLLQMTRMELQTVLTQELVENPLLEDGDEPSENDSEEEEEAPSEQAEETATEELDHQESMDDIDLDAYFNDYLESSTGPSVFEFREAPPLENTLTREADLYDHLQWQLHMSDVPARQRELAELIIGNLNPDGFLVATLEEIVATDPDTELEEDADDHSHALKELQSALALVQSFDPPGVACMDLRESLLRQLDALEVVDENGMLARRIIDEAWGTFLRRQFPALAKELGVNLADLEPVVDLISSLETRPGRKFNSERTHYIEPDVYIAKVNDEYVIRLNDDGMPRLRLSRAYRSMLRVMRSEGGEAEARRFLTEKMRSAIWLIKSLDQRQRTIYKVANSIIRQQRDFLDRGIDYLRPMVLRDVADDIGMHESTVSRVVSNKYMHTPRGLFPLKFFFHSGIDREYGTDISSLTVKRKIQNLIDNEDRRRPLSDSELTRSLKREGINIARRTVAKYRDELRIPSSTNRKQIF